MALFKTRRTLEKHIVELYQDIYAAKLKIERLVRIAREQQNEEMEHVLVATQHNLSRAKTASSVTIEKTVNQVRSAIIPALQKGGLEVAPWDSRAWGKFSL